ncbi:MAG TPA: class I SAM-dependent methyltransferase [Pyrinomonadaceae bacterium]|jgi:SAM-dependent methyltransferase
MANLVKKIRATIAAPPTPYLVTGRTQNRLQSLIDSMPPDAVILNVGAGFTNLGERVINLDIFDSGTTDVIASSLEMPFADESGDLLILQGVLEHVVSADKTLEECFRVMKKGGLFYTEMPFLQPYHATPIDLRRTTLPGITELCLPLEEVEKGIHTGPASTITWIVRELIAGLLAGGNQRIFPYINSLVGWVVFPFKYLDYWLEKKPYLHCIASAVYYIGRKT